MTAEVLDQGSDQGSGQSLEAILDRARSGQDISVPEGVTLLQQRSAGAIEQIRQTADYLRQQQAGETVTYVVNRNINFTNICEQHCSFCAFRRDEGNEGAYWLDLGQMLEKATDAVQRGATELCMQGGLNPAAKLNGSSLRYYLRILEALKQTFPQLHLHAFSPQEVEFIARQDGLSFAETIVALRDGGVDSLPGTAAEVLDDEVRRILCPEKIDSATWLEIVHTAHQQGLPTTSTLLSGHIETPAQQIRHLSLLRSLQQKSLSQGLPGISEFILLPFVGQEAPNLCVVEWGAISPCWQMPCC